MVEQKHDQPYKEKDQQKKKLGNPFTYLSSKLGRHIEKCERKRALSELENLLLTLEDKKDIRETTKKIEKTTSYLQDYKESITDIPAEVIDFFTNYDTGSFVDNLVDTNARIKPNDEVMFTHYDNNSVFKNEYTSDRNNCFNVGMKGKVVSSREGNKIMVMFPEGSYPWKSQWNICSNFWDGDNKNAAEFTSRELSVIRKANPIEKVNFKEAYQSFIEVLEQYK